LAGFSFGSSIVKRSRGSKRVDSGDSNRRFYSRNFKIYPWLLHTCCVLQGFLSPEFGGLVEEIAVHGRRVVVAVLALLWVRSWILAPRPLYLYQTICFFSSSECCVALQSWASYRLGFVGENQCTSICTILKKRYEPELSPFFPLPPSFLFLLVSLPLSSLWSNATLCHYGCNMINLHFVQHQ
jgi:hypothetical protein